MDVILPDQLPGFLAEKDRAQDATVRPAPGSSGLARFSQQLRALSSLNTQLVCMDAQAPAYEEMVRGISRVLSCDVCALFLHVTQSDHLALEAMVGMEMNGWMRVIGLNEFQRPAVQAFQEEYLVNMPDVDKAAGAEPLLQGFRSLLALPIIGRNGPIGAFEFGRIEPNAFSAEDVDMAGMLVDQMAYQLENYRLVRQLSNSRDAVIHGMARLAESRGGDIGGHLDRMCAYSKLLGNRLIGMPGYLGEVTATWMGTLARAAALHDIGKVGIPDRILLKPGMLDEDEFDVMRTHARLGSDILHDLTITHGSFPMLEMGMEVALSHHERWDGTGYPNGLSGTQIPLSARIVAIADVYDALTSRRVYKDAWSQDDTLSQLAGLAGLHFDPDLVSVFLRNPDELETIRRQYPD